MNSSIEDVVVLLRATIIPLDKLKGKGDIRGYHALYHVDRALKFLEKDDGSSEVGQEASSR